MAAFLPHIVTCSCGGTFVASLAESINVGRLPKVRDDILAGKLHRALCPTCGVSSTIEKSFLYTDPVRCAFYRVEPRDQRHRWAAASLDFGETIKKVPEAWAPTSRRTVRVVYGMDELREKLLAEDAGIDDRIVELIKVFLTHEHPVLLGRPRLRLRLDAQTTEELVFVAAYEHDSRRFALRVQRDAVDEIVKRSGSMQSWVSKAHKKEDLFVPDVHWVNMWKWSPQPRALAELEELAKTVHEGKVFVDLRTDKVRWILEHIPRGSHLPGPAKKALTLLFKLSQRKQWQEVERQIFNIRFDTTLTSDWTVNRNRKDVPTLWQLFEHLPSNNIEGNAKIHEIETGRADGSNYDPSSRDIFLDASDLKDKREFPYTVRHEVGHAVHETRKKVVDDWLSEHFHWKLFDATNRDAINAWVEAMQGWGKTSPAHRRDVITQLKLAVGSRTGEWTPAPMTPLAPRDHPWNQADFAPRRALDLSSGNPRQARHWYDDFRTWHRVGRKRFACNFYYAQLMVVSVDTLGLVAKMDRSYASMSPSEFFAEMYAKYYDGKRETRRIFPPEIQEWFRIYVEEQGTAPASARPVKSPAR